MNHLLAAGANGLAALNRTLVEVPAGEPFDRVARLAAAALKAPAALLAVLSEGREIWKGAFGLNESVSPVEEEPASSLVRHLVAGESLAVGNAALDERFARDPLVGRAGFTAFLGVPLGTPGSPQAACLMVMDSRPRTWAAEETELLRDLAACALAELELSRLRHDGQAEVGQLQRERREKAVLLTGIPLGIFLLDPEGRLTLLNPQGARFFRQVSRREPEQLLGKVIWQECPEVGDSAFARECRRAEVESRTFQLETYFPELRRWYAFHGIRSPEGLCVSFQDVTERTELEKSLRSRVEEVAESSRGKEEFLVLLAHEVRNALAPIRNALHLWGAAGPAAEEEQARAMAEREVQHVAHLLDDLLKVSQLAPGALQPKVEALELAEVVADALRTALASPEGRGQTLLVDLSPEPLPVEGDRQMLAQVLVHLLGNAAKFTRPGGQVCLQARRDGGEAVLRVRDNGIGIAPEVLPRIFDLFMRTDRHKGRLRDGLGVGLTLVRRLVELHGGTVEASSAGLGQGSEFAVRLPLVKGTVEALADPAAVGAGQKALPILIVENNKEAAQSIAVLLRAWGYPVRVTYDPLSALEEARAHAPRVILLDIGLPGMDGYEVAKRLRGQAESKGAMLVAVTGYGEEEDRRRAREAGFDYHMVKPVDPDDLRALLELGKPSTSRPLP